MWCHSTICLSGELKVSVLPGFKDTAVAALAGASTGTEYDQVLMPESLRYTVVLMQLLPQILGHIRRQEAPEWDLVPVHADRG